MSVGASYLAKIKLAAGITVGTFDTDITDLIESARAEMQRAGIDPVISISETDPLVRLAVRTFVQAHYAENEAEADRLLKSAAGQFDALRCTTGYRTESGEVITDEV